MSKASVTTLDLVSLARGVGEALGEANEAENKAASLKEAANKNIAALHSKKAKIGTYRHDNTGCALATGFIDGCVAKGIAKGTAQKVYLPTFKAAVASGKPVTDWNSKRNTKAKAAKGKTEGNGKTLAQKLATAFRDAGFAAFLQDLQASWDNGEIDNLLEGVESYLILNGALKEGEAE
jgi:hypothetical protein